MPIHKNDRLLDFSTGARRFEVKMLPAMRGWKCFVRLVKALGPSVVEMIATGGGLQDLLRRDVEVLVPALRYLFTSLDTAEMEFFVDELVKACGILEVQGRMVEVSGVFDGQFAGEIGALVQALVFSVQVNYRTFPVALSGFGAAPAKGGESKSEASTTSAGPPSA